MSTLIDPELRRLVLAEVRDQGFVERFVESIEAMLDDGRLVPVRMPDGSLGVRLGVGVGSTRQ
ncbi:hypothetical protein LB566_03365 [Mesorhizobium sp. CA13]|uniref:hypothetical protein n=1 Tax=Mesorhizobium sp. CA13 TaxID=2876643 RepID=UPI001CC9031B|nr:hypothetical protein [Mesorhizobium sp. CA13]MBZ9852822.1 hypothetical protein [Mesorhizobium sp. CA13]